MTDKTHNGPGDIEPVDELAEDDAGDLDIEVEGAEAETPADPMAALEAQVAELEAKNKDTYERLLRTTADLENFRKRSRREIEDARVDARSRTLREMLPVIDNLERAVAHAAPGAVDGGPVKSILDGVELVLRQFAQALERCDVKRVVAEDQAFDPNLHEAVSQRESAEHPAGTVVEVLQTGYTIGERLLRPAMVVVSTAAASAEPSATDSETSEGEEE